MNKPEKEYDEDSFSHYKREAIKAAKDFQYGYEVLEAIKKAKTNTEVQRIMINARHKMFGD